MLSQAQAQWFVFENPVLGKKAKEFSLTNLSGMETNLSSLKEDRPAILFFWATWCPHCRSWIAELGGKMDELRAKDIELVLVNLQETEEGVRRYLKRAGIDHDVLLDFEGRVADLYGVQGIPTFVFIASDGIVNAVEYELPEDYEKLLK